ncbi:Coproporphyrinogen III oxidase, aerobic, partial [hydrothermal vent metagenome]
MSNQSTELLEKQKQIARAWFEKLRDDICTAFEQLEDAAGDLYGDMPAGRFERT